MTAAAIASVRLALAGAELTLGIGAHVIGRSADCAVALDDLQVSRRHAVLEVNATRVSIRDLGSRNGVLVNGVEIEGSQPLVEGDLVVIGTHAIIVRRVQRVAPAPAPRPSPVALARVSVTRRAVGADELAAAVRAATTLSHSLSPLGRPIDAFRLIADAAEHAVAHERVERAVQILEAPLVEVLATLRAGVPVDPEISGIAVRQATMLYEVTCDHRWADYVHDVHAKLGEPIPAIVACRLAAVTPRG